VKLILDTHVWVRWVAAGESLTSRQLETIEGADSVAVSAVSCWEVVYLAKKGRLELPMEVPDWLRSATEGCDVSVIGIGQGVAVRAATLPDVHRDPADRFIIATSLLYNMHLMSFDEKFKLYKELNGLLL
jgi:PIN domain nuclease of toxin-antitoxin system